MRTVQSRNQRAVAVRMGSVGQVVAAKGRNTTATVGVHALETVVTKVDLESLVRNIWGNRSSQNNSMLAWWSSIIDHGASKKDTNMINLSFHLTSVLPLFTILSHFMQYIRTWVLLSFHAFQKLSPVISHVRSSFIYINLPSLGSKKDTNMINLSFHIHYLLS